MRIINSIIAPRIKRNILAKLIFSCFVIGMIISDRNQITTSFNGRVKLKDARQILAPKVVGQTKLDNMFKENKGVKAFENLSLYLKQNLVNKYFLIRQILLLKE